MDREVLVTERFTVVEKEFSRPGKPPLRRCVVVHPGAAVILPLLPDGRMVLVYNYRRTVEKELLELPAGTLETGEKPIETAARELEEETGYRAGRLELLIEFFPSPGILTERMYVYVATELEYVGQDLDENEQIRVHTVTTEEARRLLVEGRLEDGKTIAALGLYFARRKG